MVDRSFFLLEAFDTEQWCPVLQARFEVADLAKLQALIGEEARDDPDLRDAYSLDPADLAAIVREFDVRFDPTPLGHAEPDISLTRLHSIRDCPYLIHTGYELPLLLDGRKKLANMYAPYPPMTFEGEYRFEHWVAQGKLHREEELEPFDPPMGRWQGHRTVYYTPKGEEWRIPAMRLLRQASGQSGGWNEYFERLEGMLFGYEKWQNDWWIEQGRSRGGIGGALCCCRVTEPGLAWLASAGFRALPPCEKPALTIAILGTFGPDAMRPFLAEDPDSTALVAFAVPLWRARDLMPAPMEGAVRWDLPSERIPDLNRLLRNEIVIIARRDEP